MIWVEPFLCGKCTVRVCFLTIYKFLTYNFKVAVSFISAQHVDCTAGVNAGILSDEVNNVKGHVAKVVNGTETVTYLKMLVWVCYALH